MPSRHLARPPPTRGRLQSVPVPPPAKRAVPVFGILAAEEGERIQGGFHLGLVEPLGQLSAREARLHVDKLLPLIANLAEKVSLRGSGYYIGTTGNGGLLICLGATESAQESGWAVVLDQREPGWPHARIHNDSFREFATYRRALEFDATSMAEHVPAARRQHRFASYQGSPLNSGTVATRFRSRVAAFASQRGSERTTCASSLTRSSARCASTLSSSS